MTTHAEVQAWLDRYVEAWRTYDEQLIGDLFSEGAEYRFYPWAEPVTGRAGIVRSWLAPEGEGQSARDEPGTWEARYQPWAVEGDRAVAVGTSRYFATADQPERLYHNAYLLEFDADGRCRALTEFYVEDRRGEG